MTRFQKPTNIENLADLKKAKKAIRDYIDLSLKKLDGTISDIPMRLLGGTVSMVAGAFATGIHKHLQKKDNAAEAAAYASAQSAPETFGQTLKNVGEETAWFAFTKLVEKLLTK
jgi:hypothetical protein